jgi:TIR domain-containing protein
VSRPAAEHGWDVFISYAREDYQHAKDLYDALRECVTEAEQRPAVYLDVSREGTPPGRDFQQFLQEALPRSRHVIALYSQVYFTKELCQWELHQAIDLNKDRPGRLIPLMIDPGASTHVPFLAGKIHWLTVTRPTWFDELCQVLELRRAPDTRRDLRFDSGPPDVLVNHTLPEVRVTIAGPDGAPVQSSADRVTISTEPAGLGLSGTRSSDTDHGTAVFTDLSFQEPVPEVRLIASAAGCAPVVTTPFQVREPGRPEPVSAGQSALAGRGRPVFFPSGHALVLLDGDLLTVFTQDLKKAEAARLRGGPRLWARGSSQLAVADWSGRVILADPSGRVHVTDLAAAANGLCVPGALAFRGEELLVGMWEGTVWSISAGAPAQRLQHYPAGIQLLAASEDRLLAAELDGRLTVQADQDVTTHSLEPLLLGLADGPGCTLIVAERLVYRLDTVTGRLVTIEPPVTPVAHMLPGRRLTTIVDDAGRGVCFDSEVAVRTGFHTAPGARPVSGGGDDRLLVFEYPGGAHVLMRDGRIGFTASGPLAIAPDGQLAALSDGEQVILLPPDELELPRRPA